MDPFWSTLLHRVWITWTPLLLLAFFVIRSLAVRTRQVERYNLRAASTLLLGHIVALIVGVAQSYFGYQQELAELFSLSFELLSVVTLGTTAAFRVLLPRVGFVLPRILVDLVTFAGTLLVFIVVGRRAGFSVAGLITTSAVLTAVIGFSLQDTLGNVMGGLSVQLDKSIAVGDWITMVGTNQPIGRVTEIRWRYTAIETRDWETVIIPNGVLVKSQVVILGKRAHEPIQVRRTVEFFVDFRTPPSEVIDAVQSALRADPVPNSATHPAPAVLFHGVRDSFAHYVIRYWLTDLTADHGTDSAVRVRMWFALRRANIPLSIPASTLFLTHQTPEREQRKESEELERRLAALASVDMFRTLPENLRHDLAHHLVSAPFARGEAITHEGDKDDGLYMLVAGEATVRIGNGPEAKEVARLVPGQFFGEMSLMTGEARTASVIAATDLMCYRVDKPAFQRIVNEMPAVADQIAEILVMRRSALSAARDDREEVRRKRVETAKQDLLGKIRSFFKINPQ
ncbi:MAG: mechanosensitive ion channel [Deltaproteobacteria bacterium]|nr:mechanosensitive ion channel [Deltaproteobacteria bacterium]